MDGFDLRELRADALREHLGLCRGPDVFEGTIRENIHLYRSEISSVDVHEALERVGLLSMLQGFPDGLDTHVQTGGRPLSSGQVTLLMLARAIVSRPRLLLIDGGLDGLSDEEATDLLMRLQKPPVPWTLVVATSRKSLAKQFPHALRLPDRTPVPAGGSDFNDYSGSVAGD